MKNYYPLLLIGVLSCFSLSSQTTVSATYSSGAVSSQFQINPTVNNTSSCSALLHVPVPAGRYVSSVDISYDIEALGTGWKIEQFSYVECVTRSTKESAIVQGPLENNPGIANYNRSGLVFANGIVPAGGLNFRLHVFRTWGGSGCNANFQRVPNNTFTITVTHHPPPTCPEPYGLNVISVGSNKATISWTSGGASNWQVEYGPQGFTPGTGSIINAASNPFTLTGLSPATLYEFRVRDSCAVGDVSFWTPLSSFRTPCMPVPAPWTEDFESLDWVPATFGNPGSIDTCFFRNFQHPYRWQTGPPQFSSNFSGPSGDHTTGSGKYMYTEINSFSAMPDTAEFQTPVIDLSPLTIPELSFWYHMYGSGIGELEVLISNNGGVSFSSVFSKNGQQHTGKTDPWKEAIINLSAYANDSIIIKFLGIQHLFNGNSDVAIDDISVHEQPSCPQPSDITSVSTSEGFVLNWTTGGASDWQIEYGPRGFTPGTGTLVNTASRPFTLNGLSANTVYDIYVRDSCGPGDVSTWLGPRTDTTLCNVFSAPFSENFDGPEWGLTPFFVEPGTMDPCWQRSDSTGYFWKPGNAPVAFNSGPSQDHTTGSGKYIYTELTTFSLNQTSLLSPLIDCSSLTVPELRFWYHMYGAGITRLEVEVRNGSNWTLVSTITGEQQTSQSDPWEEEVVSLSAFAGDTVQVRLKGIHSTSSTATDIAIDDFWIGEAPTCPRPGNLSLISAGATSVTLDWTTGGASHWLVGYKPQGSPGPLTIVSASARPFVVSGLNPATNYLFYVKDSCAAGDVSLWEGAVSAGTLCGIITAPWSENFDNSQWVGGIGLANTGNQINSCWSRPAAVNPHFGSRFGPTTTINSGPAGDVSGSGKYIYTEASGGSGTGEISTPGVFLPPNLLDPYLAFFYHMYGVSAVSLEIEINSGTGFTNVFTLTGSQQSSNTDPWLPDTIDLSVFSGDTIQIRFSGTNSGFNGDIALDEIEVNGNANPCLDPQTLTFTNITGTSVDVNWVSGSGNSDVEIVPLGQPKGSGDLYTNQVSPLSISGLSHGTSYVVYVRDSCGPGLLSDWIADTLNTNPCPLVWAGFSFSTSNLNASFNSATSADSLYWDFGDGNSTSGTSSPVHSYSSAGIYEITLMAFNDCGSSDTLVDSVRVCDPLSAIFDITRSGDTIHFDASASSGAGYFYWDLGDGNDTTGNPISYLYASTSNKIVTLTIANDCGDSAVFTKVIKLCSPPVASWTYSILGTTGAGMQVQFDASASQNGISYEWDFGDGNTTTGMVQPVHTYTTPGLFYKVKLVVTNDCGDKSTHAYRLHEIGLEELNLLGSLKLFPNPADDVLELSWPGHDLMLTRVEILDVSGRRIIEYSIDTGRSGSQILDISSLSPGYFLLRIHTDKGVGDRQVVVR